MDKSELRVLWHESQEELAERTRDFEQQRERMARIEERRREREQLKKADVKERRERVEQQRIEKLPEIIEANKKLHTYQLEVLKRIQDLPVSESVGMAVGGHLVNTDHRRNVVATKTLPLGEIEDGVTARADIMLFQVQRRGGLGKFLLSGKFWSEPEPRRFAVQLTADGPGGYNFASFESVPNLQESIRIVSAPPELLSELRMPGDDSFEDIENIADILSLAEQQLSSTAAER